MGQSSHREAMDWNLTSYFETFGAADYSAFKDQIAADAQQLSSELGDLATLGRADTGALATALAALEALGTRVSHLSSYVGCLVAADAADEAYAAEEAALAGTGALMAKLHNQALVILSGLSTADLEALLEHPAMDQCGYALNRLRVEGRQRMSPEEEALAADLGVNGISAWSRLYFTAVSTMSFTYEDPDSGTRTAPLSQLNSLLANANRQRRIAASAGSASALKSQQHLFAAALNAISGTRLELNRRRDIKDFLQPGRFQSGIETATLNALMEAIETKVDFAREVFRFRCDALGISDPGWVDLRAALPVEGSNPSWPEGVALISRAFHKTYPDLGTFFDDMIESRWIDYSPRESKRPGGFCTTSRLTGESRIFMTYKDTLNDVLTLAHEAGHAWHAHLLRDTRLMASRYPMTLAEAASTFAERLLTLGVLDDAQTDDTTQLVLLDAEIEHMLAFLLDLPIRFRFEEAVYNERAKSYISATRLCDLMSATQRRFFGATFSETSPDPWFWASKMHFYFDKTQFYNYPYVFGYLLSQAFVSAIAIDRVEGFAAYERFLKLSGCRSCEAVVAETLGEDITSAAFWLKQIEGLAPNFHRYKGLLASQLHKS